MRIDGYLSDVEFYSDANDPTVTYAEVEVPAIGASSIPYKLFVEVNDQKLKSFIRQFVLPGIEEKVTPAELIQDAVDVLALGGNPDSVAPRVRTAGKLMDGLIEYDLNTPSREYVRVTAKDWKITRKVKHKFLKRNTLGTQVLPVRPQRDLLSLLRPYVNMDADGLILFAAWLVQGFCMGNHACALITAAAGSGKSATTKMARRILDPSNLNATMLSSRKDDLYAALANSYFVAFDNTELSQESREISDILCVAITGGTIAKRKLYTTNEVGVYELHSVVVINGVEISPAYSDLASRCLLFNLKPIDEQSRMTDEDLEKAFAQDLPEILGAIFTALSDAMTVIQTLAPKRLPRMASSYQEMMAIAISLGVTEAEFERIFFANLAALDKARANIAIVEAVQEYLNSKFVPGRAVESTVTDLYERIKDNYSGDKRDLPKSPSHFSKRLKQEMRTFHAVGISVLLDDTFADGTHLKLIKNK